MRTQPATQKKPHHMATWVVSPCPLPPRPIRHQRFSVPEGSSLPGHMGCHGAGREGRGVPGIWWVEAGDPAQHLTGQETDTTKHYSARVSQCPGWETLRWLSVEQHRHTQAQHCNVQTCAPSPHGILNRPMEKEGVWGGKWSKPHPQMYHSHH